LRGWAPPAWVNSSVNRVARSTSISTRTAVPAATASPRPARAPRHRPAAARGQRRDDQLAVLSQPGQPLRGRVGKHLLQPGDRRAQLLLEAGQLPARVRVGAGDRTEVIPLAGPLIGRQQQGGRVGVAARAGHPHVTGAQPGLHPVEDGEFPVVPVGGAAALPAGSVQVVAPAGRRLPRGRWPAHRRAVTPPVTGRRSGRRGSSPATAACTAAPQRPAGCRPG